jgi:hypothetical protein
MINMIVSPLPHARFEIKIIGCYRIFLKGSVLPSGTCSHKFVCGKPGNTVIDEFAKKRLEIIIWLYNPLIALVA